jgi:transposase
VRMGSSSGRRFFDRKIAEGKTRNEAMRCLKRRIAAHVWRRMLADELHRHLHPPKPAPPT